MIIYCYVWFCIVMHDSVWFCMVPYDSHNYPPLYSQASLAVWYFKLFPTRSEQNWYLWISLKHISGFRHLKAATNPSLRARQDPAAWHTARSDTLASQLGHQSAGPFISSSITNQVQLCYTVLSCFLETKKYQPIGCLATAWKQQAS